MIPESGENKSIDIYKATEFPYKWEKYKTILEGNDFADPTLINYLGIWYLFVSNSSHNILNIYYSDTFDGTYKAHKKNPIYDNNLAISRPAGSLFEYNNNLYRTAQSCEDGYGKKLHFLKINFLTPNDFSEEIIKTIIPNGCISWYSTHIHHFSFIENNNNYLCAFDGKGFMYRWNKYIKRK